MAHCRRELASFLLAGLTGQRMASVVALKSRLHQLASYRLSGRAVRAGLARGPETAKPQEGEAAANWANWLGPLLQDFLPNLAAG